MHRIKCILRSDPHPDDPEFFESVMAAVAGLTQLGFRLEFESEEVGVEMIELRWGDADELANLFLVKDLDTNVCWMSVAASRTADLRRIVRALAEKLDIVELPELLVRAQTARAQEPTILLKLALAAGATPDPDIVSILVRSFDHRLPAVRYYAAWAVGILLWPAFIPELERLLKLERDTDVAEIAERALNGCWREERLAARR